MVIRNAETTQGDGGLPSATPAPADQLRSRAGNTVFKSGPLLLSSKGIGWTSWKKRWFILTRTSLVFFRSDPSVIPHKGSEVNLTLGGIDLNNSGSVVVKEDKKLLTVLFPDGRDGRAFTLKAETSEDLFEWKAALESALAQAPSAAIVMGQNAILQNDPAETTDGPQEQLVGREKRPVKSLVVGRPILLALEDVDGAPSFLEKALTFIEQYGVKVEGILRQAADVDDVERRVREYEQGKNEFSTDEDAHVIADCVKHVLRELPSSPVPASCCTALLQACRTERGGRINAMRAAISETFPEPNRRLLQRILRMMQVVASHKSENRMSSSAVAACMAPLLLRPLLAGDCELENDFNMGGDGSVQLLQAAAAANHAQTIVITLLEEYDKIFGDGILQEDSISPGLCSDSEQSGSEDYEPTDDKEFLEDDEYIDSQHDSDVYTEYDPEGALSGTASESSGADDDQYDDEVSEGSGSDSGSSEVSQHFEDNQNTPSETQTSFPQHDNVRTNGSLQSQGHSSSMVLESHGSPKSVPASISLAPKTNDQCVSSSNMKFTAKSSEPVPYFKRPTVWGRTPARKNLSMESIDYVIEDEAEIERLEITKTHLQNKIAKEVKENGVLHSSLERRKKDLHERRLALEKDVESLKEQLQKERDLRAAMEAWLPTSPALDDKTKAELEEISQAEEDIDNLKKKAAELRIQLNQQRNQNHHSFSEQCNQPRQIGNSQPMKNDQRDDVEDTTASSHEKSTRSEDASSRVEKPQEKSSLPRKQPAEKKQTDLTSLESKKSAGNTTTSSSTQPFNIAPSASSNSKKSNAKPEQGTITTSYALSKLTNRLNFLKERRTQIVNELQNMENSRGSEGQSVGALPRTTSR